MTHFEFLRELAIGGFDSASALALFVSNWAKYAKLFPLLESRITIGVNYPGALCSMAACGGHFAIATCSQ
jgi:hypothetical protein